ncbi:hypothetical protein F7D01_05345 [Erythrobacter sp. 3-20A1M]|uniref:spike base protein, RCAP_Rcc01079 family n=1 Tax=Erythrobacter sp. 3-20A1M TaxID=2653850 RepID=UPI001BFC60B2|nr:hypothetical protein [Erythrobacter sp. 3-20A1M]QWC56594.1 hypothetical protein F7D01_05345 [Erythrobacter sp. 3-20A1M]
MTDRFGNYGDSVTAPARQAFAITPSDEEALPLLPKALLIGQPGTVVLRATDSDHDVAVTAQAGQLLPIRASHVRANGTTAGTIVGLA